MFVDPQINFLGKLDPSEKRNDWNIFAPFFWDPRLASEKLNPEDSIDMYCAFIPVASLFSLHLYLHQCLRIPKI